MPRFQMKADANTGGSQVAKFDRLDLKTGEEARLWVPNEDFAFMEYVHTLKKPIFEESGKPMKEIKQVRGGDKEVFKTEFKGRRICSGDPDVLDAGKPDPENCVVCAVVKQMIDSGIEDATELLAQRRYALPVIRYKITGNDEKFTVRLNPPQADLLIWSFAPGTYRKIESVRNDAAEVLSTDDRQVSAADIRLQMIDICVHCDSGTFKMLGKVSAKRRAWASSPEVKAVVSALWNHEENRPTDAQLKASLGRDPDPRWGKEDAEDVADAYHKAVNWDKGGSSAQVSGGGDLSEDLDDLLDEGPAKPAAEAHPGGLDEFAGKAPAEVTDDLLDDIAPAPAAAPAAPAQAPAAPAPVDDDDPFADTPAPAPAKVPVTSGAPADSDTFDELLAD